MDQQQIMNLVGLLLQWIAFFMGGFFVVRGLIDVAIANSNDNPNAKDTAYLKLGTGIVLGIIGTLIPDIIDLLIPELDLNSGLIMPILEQIKFLI